MRRANLRKASAYVDRPVPTVRRWIREGKLPATRLGRTIEVDLDDLDRMRQPVGCPAVPVPAADVQVPVSHPDEVLAVEFAARLLPLASWQREKLAALLLSEGDR